ncbi:hypothetical protein JHK82_023588 [Glycine max]|nr:hypothetical protein JHK86_023648 [Glycine max]KAG5132400.1 hypothetical protein JHK82_023588 [Glycine max]
MNNLNRGIATTNLILRSPYSQRILCAWLGLRLLDCEHCLLYRTRYSSSSLTLLLLYLRAVGRGVLGVPVGEPKGSIEYLICLPAHGAIIGAWFGAWPMSLD